MASEHVDNLKITDDPILGPSIVNVTEANFTSPADTRRLLQEGDRRRHFGVTNMNAHSSRSHVIVRLNIEARKVATQPAKPLRQSWGKDKPTCFSTLNLVDLAGSERANKAGTSGQSLKEGSFINKSLLTLGTVIAQLSDESKSQAHIPYRNSKLTRLLSSALGGNAKTCMIACISPAQSNVHESLSTLRFASRAKSVVNHVRKNVFDDARTLAEMLTKQKAEFDMLKDELDRFRLSGGMEGPMKEKACLIAKKHVALRLVSMNYPRLLQMCATSERHRQLASKVRESMRSGVMGTKDILDVLDEQRELLVNYFPKASGTARVVAVFDRLLESDGSVYFNDGEDEDDPAITDGFSDPLFDLVDEETAELIETLRMRYEDLHNFAFMRISKLEHLNQHQVREIQSFASKLDQTTNSLKKAEVEISNFKESEVVLKKTIENQREQMEGIKLSSGDRNEKLQLKIEELVSANLAHEQTITDLQHVIGDKNFEIKKLETNCESLNVEIKTRSDELVAFQSESLKARNEQRRELERIRGSMSNMLRQGGETAKVLETQNAYLHKERELLRDELEGMRKTKNQLTHQNTLLRGESERYFSEFKNASAELQKLKAEMASTSEQLTTARLRLNRASAQCTTAEEKCEGLAKELAALQARLASSEELHTTERRRYKETTDDMLAKLRLELNAASTQVISYEEVVKNKDSEIQRLVNALQSEESRLESRLKVQMQQNDALAKELDAARQHSSSMIDKLTEESRELKVRLNELEKITFSVNSFLSKQKIDQEMRASPVDETFDDLEMYNIKDLDIDTIAVESPHVETKPLASGRSTTPSTRRLGWGFDAEVNEETESAKIVRTEPESKPKSRVSTSPSQLYPPRFASMDAYVQGSPLTRTATSVAGKSMQTSYSLSTFQRTESQVSSASSSPERYATTRNDGKLGSTASSRFDEVLDVEAAKMSARYQRVRFSLKVLDTSLRHALTDDSVLRNYMAAATETHIMDASSSHRDADRMRYNVNLLQGRLEEASAEIDELRQKYGEAKSLILKLERDLSDASGSIGDARIQEQRLITERDALSSQVVLLRAELETSHQEAEGLRYDRKSLQLRVAELSHELEAAGMSHEFLRIKLDQQLQQLSVVKAQRDELAKQYMGDRSRFESDEFGVDDLVSSLDDNNLNGEVGYDGNENVDEEGDDFGIGFGRYNTDPPTSRSFASRQSSTFPKPSSPSSYQHLMLNKSSNSPNVRGELHAKSVNFSGMDSSFRVAPSASLRSLSNFTPMKLDNSSRPSTAAASSPTVFSAGRIPWN